MLLVFLKRFVCRVESEYGQADLNLLSDLIAAIKACTWPWRKLPLIHCQPRSGATSMPVAVVSRHAAGENGLLLGRVTASMEFARPVSPNRRIRLRRV
ncbi:hypothetical protein AGR1A_Lc120005 [Agrobacterium fabacearum CFBP 5771]|nr:hypothetical protein AGR1A_Lc120005 [Agrobacterium fabacearum CFBP 5771]